jgi:hypothetical protein
MAQAELAATHFPVVSQQPIPGPTPLHTLPAQQTSPDEPQSWHVPAAQTSFPPVPQAVPAAWHLAAMQQLPPVHWLAAQQPSPDAPHFVHAPFSQTLPAVLQSFPLPTQVLLAGSQHEPLPAHAGPVTQQTALFAPHGVQLPLKQTCPVVEHARLLPTQVLSLGSQQSVADVHVLPAQHRSLVAPHGEQVPLLQTV